LHKALEKEKELSDLKSRFVSMASHEFRTPLSSILSSASLIGKYPEQDQQPQRDKHINRIKDSVRHLNSILEDLLSIGRLEEGKVQVKPRVFNYCEFLWEVVDEVKILSNRGQQIIVECEDDSEVCTDKALLRNVLLNLLSNAVKFSKDSGVVTLRAGIANEAIYFEIKDEGIGISMQDQEHLFERFFRAQNASNIQGTGLGLFIVRRYLDLIGGTISWQSELNIGTTFRVSFVPMLPIPVAENSL